MANVPTTKRCLAKADIKKTLDLFGDLMKDDPGIMYSIDQDEEGED